MLALLLLLFTEQAHAFGSKRVAADPNTTSTLLDGDATGIVEGCGQQPSTLGMFCRQQEGDASNKSVWFIGPPAKCNKDEACVFIKIWNAQGQLVWGGSIPKSQTRIEVPWSTLLGRQTFELGDRGFWTFNTQVFWVDQDGKDRESLSQGDIVLRVFKKTYQPLHAVLDDPNFVWTWEDGSFQYKMTSGLRASIRRLK